MLNSVFCESAYDVHIPSLLIMTYKRFKHIAATFLSCRFVEKLLIKMQLTHASIIDHLTLSDDLYRTKNCSSKCAYDCAQLQYTEQF